MNVTDTNLFENVRFCYPFRDYQRRVLEQIDELLGDEKLHVVAAPGSGKTVLGLEVIRRINRKTLILVPTVNLRNQWKQRFLELFLSQDDEDMRQKWEQLFSDDLKNPGIITCTTYQALHHLYKEKQEEGADAFRALLCMYKKAGIQTICLDEAHHLKQEWWKALTEFVGGMEAKLISLTATPPMDTSDLEWKRYIELCGDIDLEIFVPEMVVKKCLCPHQDYLYLCKPTDAEKEKADEELQNNRACINQILRDVDLYREIKQLPFLVRPKKHAGLLVKYPDYLEHIVSYAAYVRDNFHMELEGSLTNTRAAFHSWDRRIQAMVQNTEVTEPSAWFVPLMRDILENNPEYYSEELREKLRTMLSKNHMLRNGKASMHHSVENFYRILHNSASKLDAIVDIAQAESNNMGKTLRCLVLMDYIRKEDLSKVATEEPLTDLGVCTVFERLRRQEHLGNLETYFAAETNPNVAQTKTYRTRLGVLTGSLVILPEAVMDRLSSTYGITNAKKIGVTGYAILEGKNESTDEITTAVTQFFEQGQIEILIGTASLLGEGWDAPAVNSLLIGSTSATYVKTNQMRGRALRIDRENPDKVSNVWHFMAVADMADNSPEYPAMKQRFDTILGLSMDGKRVENGINRLLDEGHTMDPAEQWNEWMKEKAADRKGVLEAWKNIRDNYGTSEVRNVVAVQEKPDYRANTRWLKKKQLLRVANAIVSTLKERNMIREGVVLKCTRENKQILFYLECASEHDSRLFADCMRQAVSPLSAPKYMIRLGFFRHRHFAVPDVLATRKEIATQFCTKMNRGAKLFYSRTSKGELELLNAKIRQSTVQRRAVEMVKELM